MAASKSSDFPDKQAELARFFKALAHPARVAILELLAEKGVCICGEIVDELPLAQSTVSQHLMALKEIGLIQGEIEGPAICYCIDAKTVAAFRMAVDEYLESITQPCC